MDKVSERYLRTKELFEKHHNKIVKDLENSSYLKSAKAIYRQQDKIAKLTDALLAIQGTADNFYSIQSISRILIEHFIVGHYIFTKVRLTKSDSVGEEYYTHYDISEFFKRENYELAIKGIRENKKKLNTFANILLKNPEFVDMEESELPSIHKTAKQFDIRDIFQYFINDSPDDIFKDFNYIMLEALSDYNHLSSYVHGGPTAELEAYEGRQNTNKEERIQHCIGMAKTYSRTMKDHVLFLLWEDLSEYKDIILTLFPDLELE